MQKYHTLLDAQTFSAVLLDLSMPHIAGTDLLPEILARYPGTPVIIISAGTDTETALQCMRQGALAYLPPFLVSLCLSCLFKLYLAKYR